MSSSRQLRYSRRRRARVKAAENNLTTAQWRAILAAWDACAYCGGSSGESEGKLQKDCVQPIAWGGAYTASNVVPACRSCNASKCNTEVTGWMRRKHLDEGAFLERWAQVRRELASAWLAANAVDPVDTPAD